MVSHAPGGDGAGPARDLLSRLVARVASDGPMSVAAYMAEALYDPRAGYYRTKDPIGAGADYVTAPEISQMFGELIGLWSVQTWLDLGAPAAFDLIELGPGRGTMLADALRAARLEPRFLAAAQVTLVEASPALEAAQAQMLADAPCRVTWTDRLPVGDRPAIMLGNEFLDCLPVRQFVKRDGAWRERLVGLDPSDPGRLAFLLAPAPVSARDLAVLPEALRDAPEGALVEARPTVEPLIESLAARFAKAPGRALLIDYGPAESEIGDTLQALKAHEKVDPLAFPGEADLTARVDFAEVARLARAHGLDVAGPVGQGEWLKALGIEHRAAALRASRPDMRATIARQVHRLTDENEMGALFKAVVISARKLPAPAGF
jgi:NADH dehydrogenase [ubiquinone] 1 alpha subcomplex assembly factor 7